MQFILVALASVEDFNKYIPVMRLLIIMYLAKIYRKTSTIEALGILFMKRPDRKRFSSLSLEFDLNQRISFFCPSHYAVKLEIPLTGASP